MRTKEELGKLLLENKDLFQSGLCAWIVFLKQKYIITSEEMLFLINLVKRHKKVNTIDEGFHIGKRGDIRPRIEWIKKYLLEESDFFPVTINPEQQNKLFILAKAGTEKELADLTLSIVLNNDLTIRKEDSIVSKLNETQLKFLKSVKEQGTYKEGDEFSFHRNIYKLIRSSQNSFIMYNFTGNCRYTDPIHIIGEIKNKNINRLFGGSSDWVQVNRK